MKKIGILNVPNLGRLGKREPHIYGHQTLKDLENLLIQHAAKLNLSLDCFQSNHEGLLIDKIESWVDSGFSGVVINPGGLTHTSVILRDAISAAPIPFIEVHLSNIYSREDFRHKSITAPVCKSIISGLSFNGYIQALNILSLSNLP